MSQNKTHEELASEFIKSCSIDDTVERSVLIASRAMEFSSEEEKEATLQVSRKYVKKIVSKVQQFYADNLTSEELVVATEFNNSPTGEKVRDISIKGYHVLQQEFQKEMAGMIREFEEVLQKFENNKTSSSLLN